MSFISPLPLTPMLWSYKLNYAGFIDAPADIAQARHALAEKIKTDPYAFISKVEPVEPSVKTVADFAKAVIGLR